MALDELTATLEREASLREESILRDAQQEAERLLAAARSAVASLAKKEERLRRDREQRAERLRASDRVITARLRQTAIERELAERLKAMVTERFSAFMRSDAYAGWLATEIERGAEGLGDDYSLLVDRLSEAALKKITTHALRVEEGINGFVLLTADGKIRIDATMEKRLTKVWRMNAPFFARALKELIDGQL